jgi:hypothetical protein
MIKRLFLFLICFLILLGQLPLYAAKRPDHISKKVWHKVEPYLLPDDHHTKPILDKIFQTRALLNKRTMRHAGFIKPEVRRWTHIVVTSHSDLPGYLIKANLDVQRYQHNRPEHKCWSIRVRGARAIQKILDEHNWNHLFKVPKKWIYALPKDPKPPEEFLRKNFILIEENMNLVDKNKNKKSWKKQITKEHLDALYYILTKTGLSDGIKTHNIPFSEDGRISFIDTDSYKKGKVDYSVLTKHLSPEMQKYWKKLYSKKHKKNK